MNWNDLLAILLQTLAAELPELLAAVAAWLKRKLETLVGDNLMMPAVVPTGTLEEFKAAVRAKIQEVGARLPIGVRFLWNRVMSRLTDNVLDKVYQIVVGNEPAPQLAMACPDEVSELLDGLTQEAP